MPTKTHVNTDIPEGMNVEALGEQMDKNPAKKSAPASKSADGREYTPSDKTLERLNGLPKDEIKEKYGLDIDNLIKKTKVYGILEGLAYGNFTKYPLPIVIHIPYLKKTKMYATVRLYQYADKESGEMKLGLEYHPVKRMLKLDDKGNPILNTKGEKAFIYDCNKLQPNSIIEISTPDGKSICLSQEQVNRLRLTGNLGEPILSADYYGKPTMTIYSVDPYNNHALIGATVESITKRLEQENEFKYKDAEKNVHTVSLSARMKGALAMGQSQWGRDEAGNNVCIQYNTASGRLERAQDYELALRNEVSRKQETANKKSIEQGRKQAEAEGKTVGQKL